MTDDTASILAGTLDLLILKTLSVSPFHGYGIAQHIKRLSRDALTVEEGSLYPALQRMQVKGWVASEWKTTYRPSELIEGRWLAPLPWVPLVETEALLVVPVWRSRTKTSHVLFVS